MKWDMQIDEVEGILETILDIHDKLSDAIHSVTTLTPPFMTPTVSTLLGPPSRTSNTTSTSSILFKPSSVLREILQARLEHSRIVLAMRLAEHCGKKYKVIEEALAFVGDVHDPSSLIAPDILYGQNYSSENFVTEKAKGSNMLINIFVSSFNFVKKSLGLDHMGGIVGNAALVAVSMIALLHLHQETRNQRMIGSARESDGIN